MTAAIAKTKGPDLLDELSVTVSNACRFLDPADRSIKRLQWEKTIEQVMTVDAVAGSVLKAKLHEYMGDVQQVEYWLNNACKLASSRSAFAENRLVAYCNLGYGSKGLQVFRDHVDIANGNIGATAWLAIGVGAFQYMKNLIEQAQRGNVEIPSTNLEIGQRIADVMAESGTTDDTCAAVIDIAGQVLRKHRLFWLGQQADFIIDEHDKTVLMRFRVDASYEDAEAMSIEAAQLLIDRDLDSAAYMIDFVGVKS